MIQRDTAALVLAPMDGVTDAPMRSWMGGWGAFSFSVSEFLRVSESVLPRRVFLREVPELGRGSRTDSGMPVAVQLLGGHPGRMAESALQAVRAGASMIDINFGCPAPTVNRHDGGAALLRFPRRICEIVAAVRQAVPCEIPVSAKLRLGWECIEDIHENAAAAVEGGASWLTIHARTRTQGYAPPVFWHQVGAVRRAVPVPVVANGDIWNLADFRECREVTGCSHFMLGRGALADPWLPAQVALELGLLSGNRLLSGWSEVLTDFVRSCAGLHDGRVLGRLKQWAALGAKFGTFPAFAEVKRCSNVADFLAAVQSSEMNSMGPSESGGSSAGTAPSSQELRIPVST